jgi:hypothetical protein
MFEFDEVDEFAETAEQTERFERFGFVFPKPRIQTQVLLEVAVFGTLGLFVFDDFDVHVLNVHIVLVETVLDEQSDFESCAQAAARAVHTLGFVDMNDDDSDDGGGDNEYVVLEHCPDQGVTVWHP